MVFFTDLSQSRYGIFTGMSCVRLRAARRGNFFKTAIDFGFLDGYPFLSGNGRPISVP
jgi:hypothetical protein